MKKYELEIKGIGNLLNSHIQKIEMNNEWLSGISNGGALVLLLSTFNKPSIKINRKNTSQIYYDTS